MKLKREGAGDEYEVEIVSREGLQARVRLNGAEAEVQYELLADGSAMLAIDGVRVRVAVASRKDRILVAAGAASFELREVAARAHRSRALLTPEIVAPMPGKVLKIMVAEGQRVEAHDGLVVLEAMKMETTLSADSPAVVRKIRVAVGEIVDHGAVLIELSPLAADPSAQESAPRAS